MRRRFKVGQGVFVDDGLGRTLHGHVVEIRGSRVGVRIGAGADEEVRYFDQRGLYDDEKCQLGGLSDADEP